MTTMTNLRRAAAAFAAAGALLLAGCATVANPNPRDPWEPMNRSVSQFNDGVDAMVLKPVATVYRQGVPPLIRTGVANFFGNLNDAWSFVNSLLQFKLQNAEENLARFHINTMFGLFGIFDVASDLNIDKHSEDFGQTLGHWGVPAGPYLVLPFFGPSTLRDTAALPIDRRFDLVQTVNPYGARTATYALRAVEKRSNLIRVGNVLDEAALDKYSFVRDAHLQRRRAVVYEREDDPRALTPPPLPDDQAAPRSQPPAPAAR
jgi:phospholipid-binding lipoprotein MlaA